MEQWKPVHIDFYSNYYEVSNTGLVKSCERKISRFRGNSIYERYEGNRILSPGVKRDGYKIVILQKEKIKKTCSVARLVAEAFIPNPENKPEVNHINGNKIDNRIENLEWVTRSEQQKHAFTTGLNSNKGKNALTTDNDVHEILVLRLQGFTHKSIGEIFGLAISTSCKICKSINRTDTVPNSSVLLNDSDISIDLDEEILLV